MFVNSLRYCFTWKGSSCEIRRGSVARLGNIRFTRQVGAAGAASKRNYLKFQCNRKHWLAGDRNRTSEEHTGRGEMEQG